MAVDKEALLKEKRRLVGLLEKLQAQMNGDTYLSKVPFSVQQKNNEKESDLKAKIVGLDSTVDDLQK